MSRAAELLDVLVKRAPALRAAGVRSVIVEGLSFELDPTEPPAPRAPSKRELEALKRQEIPADPFDDPMSYPAGFVPRRLRPDAKPSRPEPVDEHE